MDVVLLAAVALALLMARSLADLYLGGRYTCPSCGAKAAHRHSSNCPWSRRR